MKLNNNLTTEIGINMNSQLRIQDLKRIIIQNKMYKEKQTRTANEYRRDYRYGNEEYENNKKKS